MNTHYTLYTKYKIQTTPVCIWDHTSTLTYTLDTHGHTNTLIQP